MKLDPTSTNPKIGMWVCLVSCKIRRMEGYILTMLKIIGSCAIFVFESRKSCTAVNVL